jgi:hypothetical protein
MRLLLLILFVACLVAGTQASPPDFPDPVCAVRTTGPTCPDGRCRPAPRRRRAPRVVARLTLQPCSQLG